MTEEVVKTEQTDKICLFDFEAKVLQKIYTNEGIFHLLKKSGNDGFLDDIDMFLDLSDEDGMWVVREEDREKAREKWSFELPVEIAEEIKKIAEENSQGKLVPSIGDL